MTSDRRTVALLEALRLATGSRARADVVLDRIAIESSDRALREGLSTLAAALRSGVPLETALELLDRHLDSEALAIVAAGVRQGDLDASVDRALERLDRRERSRAALRGVLLRPLLVVVTSALLWLIAGPLLLPEVAALTRDVWPAGDAPLCARVAAAVAARPQEIAASAALLVGAVAALLIARRHPPFDRMFARACLALPVVGPLEAVRVGSLTVHMAEMLTRASRSPPEVVAHLARFVDNAHVARCYRSRLEAAQSGVPLSKLLVFDDLLASDGSGSLIDAERRSALPTALAQLASRLDEELQQRVDRAVIGLHIGATLTAATAAALFVWVFHLPIVLASGALP